MSDEDEWRRVASDCAVALAAAQDRWRSLAVVAAPHDERVGEFDSQWRITLDLAKNLCRELRHRDGELAWRSRLDAVPPPTVEMKPTIGVHADAIVAMQMRHEECLAALHRSRAIIARLMATRRVIDGPEYEAIAADLESERVGMSRVARGLPWSDE